MGTGQVYSKEEVQNISALGEVLKRVRSRLIHDGISIEDERRKLLLKINDGSISKYKHYDPQRTKRKTIQK
jgi:hypothetical protein